MKKFIVLIALMIMPISISANVLCGDGTTSEKCSACDRGCCSHHGGCVGPIEEKVSEHNNNEPVINEPVIPEPAPEVIAPAVEVSVATNKKTITKTVTKDDQVVSEESSVEVSEEISTEVQSREEMPKEEKSSEDDDSDIFVGLAALYVALGIIASVFLIPFFIIKNAINKKKLN